MMRLNRLTLSLAMVCVAACGGECSWFVSVVCAGEAIGTYRCEDQEECRRLGELALAHPECPADDPGTHYTVGTNDRETCED